ncbi:MAG TPA: HAD family hydrolase [Candidatus Wallbacteria bacterium]|mgnify:CR=1 FL=1|nr:HAD family hydrolase [Candidatus Wallbacteria bacterium]
MKFKAAIFDLDGTLLNTIDDLADSMNFVLEKCGYPGHTVEAYKYFVGDGMEKLVRRSLPENFREAKNIKRCLEMMMKEYGLRWADKTKPYDGIADMLSALSLLNVKLSVLSNKPDGFTKMMIEKFFPEIRFEHVNGASEHFAKKPDPSAAIDIAQKTGFLPEEVLYAGDTAIDMKTALGARMYATGVLWGFRKKDELLKAGAMKIIEKPEELIGFFR